ncbi:MAG: PEP/pyruvate-binding domain-containing protein [Phycisphaeraceae bacterium]
MPCFSKQKQGTKQDLTMPPVILTFESINHAVADHVGGKGLNLGLLTTAGLPVPPGFCVTSDAYVAAVAGAEGKPRVGSELRDAILQAYAALSRGLVAVRSSATMEDGATASFAGQQETILGVEGDEDLIAAIERCWHSLFTERASAYRKAQNIPDSAVAMAVVVQRLVESEVSGVLFTRDPLDASGRRMLIEAARGLGESVVSGSVMPDRFHTDRETGAVLDQEIHTQRTMHTKAGVVEVAVDLQGVSCMTGEQLAELTALGREVEAYYGQARDIEWAIAEGKCFLLQARPITAAGAGDLEAVRLGEIAALKAKTDKRGTVWARYNLAEVLPEPTPMTWSIVRRFMSGSGGFGLMYRDLGFDPDPCLDEEGFIDLVCGRPYVNLSREPKLYFRDFPYGYPFAELKKEPGKAIYPTPVLEFSKRTGRFFTRLPAIMWSMFRSGKRMKKRAATQAQRLERDVFPAFRLLVDAARNEELSSLSPVQLLQRGKLWIQRTLVDLARESLQPSMFAAAALADVEAALKPAIGEVRARAVAQALMTGVTPGEESDLAGAVKALASGAMSEAVFLDRFGHRGPNEMELASPRWREESGSLPRGEGQGVRARGQGAALRDGHVSFESRWQYVARSLHLDADEASVALAAIQQARTYLGLREAGKNHLMMGYAIIRESLVEIGRRLNIGDGLFFLQLDELENILNLPSETNGQLTAKIDARKSHRRLALSLNAPQAIFSDDLDAIGRAVKIEGATELRGTPVSFGVYEGEALVLTEPVPADSVREGFVLVCPSTDPAWVPLFLKAKALVMETGGVLSHGAIVAREFGIPAVAGIAQAHQRITTGQRLHVDGTSGVVQVIVESEESAKEMRK